MHLALDVLAFGLFGAALLAVGAVGFTLQFAVTNVLNFAYGAIATSGIFIDYGLRAAGASWWIGLIGAAVGCAVLSWMLGMCIVNPYVRRGTSLFGMAMVMIGVALIVEFSLEAIEGPIVYTFPEGPVEVHFLSLVMSLQQLGIIGLAVVAMLAVYLLLKHTRLGLAMRATAAQPALARVSGISTNRVRAVAWLVSGALCGLSGALLGLSDAAFNSTTGNAFFITVIAAATVGGIGKPYGAMAGALLIGLVTELAANFISPSYKDVVAFVILIIVLIARPRGLFAELASTRKLAQ